DLDMIYRYKDVASYLARLAYTWRQKVRIIDHPLGLQSWGPSAEALAEANIHELTAQVESEEDGSDDGNSSESSAEEDTDEELYDHMEALVLNEHYKESRDFIMADVDKSSKRRRLD
ncbi:hypothetical protein FIBSPDRAFT_906177, partial [Athelia psychrophila]